MGATEDRENWATDQALILHEQTVKARDMKKEGKSNAEIAKVLGIPENTIRQYFHYDINWGYNCLTVGIHHGRPEAIWNLPLLQTTFMFELVQLQRLVIDRIYNDAMQFVEHGNEPRMPKTWADQVKALATPMVLPVYQRKIGEITKYYRSPEFKRTLNDAIERNKQGKLNPGYAPSHGHDTLNLLCRIVGVSASTKIKDVR